MDNHDLNGVATFVAVARADGFSAAARQLNLPRSTVSLRVRALETRLGVRLFKRSTRSVALTQEGRALLAAAGPGLDQVAEAMAEAGNAEGELRGTIRMTAPADFLTEVIATAVSRFRVRHPRVTFELILTNAVLDLVGENVDIALRVSSRSSADTVMRSLPPFKYGLYASPDYLARTGMPTGIDGIADFVSPHRAIRTFLEERALGGATLPSAAIEANNFLLVRDLVLTGAGIGLIPSILCTREIAEGRLVGVLDAAVTSPIRMALAFPTRADMVPRVRAFADMLYATLAASP